jgi:hypothetical protein
MVCETLSEKPITERAGGMAQGIGPEFNPQDQKKPKRILRNLKEFFQACILTNQILFTHLHFTQTALKTSFFFLPEKRLVSASVNFYRSF